jgi:hypothetical protein
MNEKRTIYQSALIYKVSWKGIVQAKLSDRPLLRVQLKNRIDKPNHNRQIYTDEISLSNVTSREQGCAKIA